MAQSVELLLDEPADAAVRHEWDLLADAGLPSERRSGTGPGSEHHGPHITVYAADGISETAERALPTVVAGLDLDLQLGALTLFGPRHGTVVLVRQVIPALALLTLHRRVSVLCEADPLGHFGPGRWSPHVTLAHRVPVERVSELVAVLGPIAARPLPTRVTRCRRWDGTRKTAWLL